MSAPWDTLGIAATGDVLAIKKAYAARLKLNRPEDDPAAYQALREAYDIALTMARSQQMETAPREEAPASTPAPTGTTDAAAAGPPADNTEAPQEPDYILPRDLAHQTVAYLREAGSQALVDGWPQLEIQLDRLPLRERAEASNWFAQLVIDIDPLPPPFAQALSRYFGWEGDFRSEYTLGAQRAAALRERLQELAQRFYPDEPFRQRYGIVGFFGYLAEHLPDWKLRVFTLLAPSHLRARWQELSPRERYAIGMPPPRHSFAELCIEQAAVARLLLVLLLCGVLVQWEDLARQAAPVRVLFAFIFGAGMLAFLHMLAGAHQMVRTWIRSEAVPWHALSVEALSPQRLAWLAWAGLVVATAMCHLLEAGMLSAQQAGGAPGNLLRIGIGTLLLFALFGPSFPPPGQGAARVAVLGASATVTFAWFASWVQPITAMLIGAVWFMLCLILHGWHSAAIDMHWRNARMAADERRAQGHSVGLSLAGAFLLHRVFLPVVGWPYWLLDIAATRSTRFAIGLVSLAILALPLQHEWALLPFTLLVAAALLQAEALVHRFGFRALMPQQSRPWLGWLGLGAVSVWLLWALCYLGGLGTEIDARLGLSAPVDEAALAWRRIGLGLVLPCLAIAIPARLRLVRPTPSGTSKP